MLWQNWINKRFQFKAEKQLTQKDVLVFIYQQGYVYVVLILITFIAGVNYANNLILAFCFLISAVLCMSFYLTFKQLHGLSIELVLPEIGQVESALQLQMHFKQHHSQPRYLWLAYADHIEQLFIQDTHQVVDLNFFPKERGQFSFPEIKIYSTYPFGLVRAWSYFFIQKTLWIAPKAKSLAAENKQQQHSFEPDMDEFRELRNFKEGDSLQAVSWKQVAQGQGLFIKVFEQHQDQHSLEIHYAHMPSPSHEEKLSLMMGLVEQCEQLQYAYALYLPDSELAKGIGREQYLQAKLLLAQA